MAAKEQSELALQRPIPSTAQARKDRERRLAVARVQRRKSLEERAAEIFRRGTHAAGVDAIVADTAFDRSQLYAMGRGARPPQLAPFLVAVEDRAVGPELLRELAAPHGLVLVKRGEEAQAAQPSRGLVDIIADLFDAMERAGVLGDVQAARLRRRAA